MNAHKKVIPYRARWSWIIGGGLFCSLAAPALIISQIFQRHGLIIGHAIELSADTVTLIYWIMAAICLGLVGLCLALAVHRLAVRQTITLTERSITFPRSFWSQEEVEILFTDVTHSYTSHFMNLTRLHLGNASGQEWTIWFALVPSRQAQADLQRLLLRPAR